MPDVLKIAQDRRAKLLKEIAALDRFIEMANALLAREAAKASAQVTPLKATGSLTPTPAAPPTRPTAKADSETEAFLRERASGRASPDANKTAHQGLANLARS